MGFMRREVDRGGPTPLPGVKFKRVQWIVRCIDT